MSVYISRLPVYTGSATDLRWFVMNNSGETETYKYSGYTSPFKSGDATNSIIPTYYPSSSATTSGTTYVEKLKAFGKNVEITDGTNTTSNIVGNLILGKNNTLSQDKYNFVMGESNNVSGAGAPGIVGNIVLGAGNNIPTYGYGNLVIGGYNTVEQPYNIRMGNNGSINGSGNLSIGEQVNITANYCAGVGAYNSISTNYSYSFGNNNDITGTGEYNGIWGGKDNSITGGTYISMVGTSGRTGTLSATTYVENLHTYRTPSTQVQPVSSGTTFTCNLDNGAKSQFYLTGTSTINITNVRDGASFMIKTQTNGNYNITWTATGGYTFVFEGGIHDPGNNNTDIFVFEVFGSVIYGNRRHNYS